MRQVVPELLDSLPEDDPAAQRSRREIRFINRLMGNHRWLCRVLKDQKIKGQQILELGAGDGTLAKLVWIRGIVPPGHWSGLDWAPRPLDWPSAETWHQRNLNSPETLPDADIIVANLVLHHLHDSELAALGTRLPDSCRLLIACEPARRNLHLAQSRLLSVVANLGRVTRHDILVSIRGGFIADELSSALGLRGWKTKVSVTFLGAYRLIAWR